MDGGSALGEGIQNVSQLVVSLFGSAQVEDAEVAEGQPIAGQTCSKATHADC